MQSVQLVLVRHGQTEANKAGILQGHCDYPLTELGVSEAMCTGRALKNVQWYKCYCSDLIRTQKTMNLILNERLDDEGTTQDTNEGSSAKKRKQQVDFESQTEGRLNSLQSHVLLTSALREIAFGVREALPRSTTIEEARRIVALRTGVKPEEVEDRTETVEAVLARQRDFLRAIIRDSLSDSNKHYNGGTKASETAQQDLSVQEGKTPPPVLCVSHGGYIRTFITQIMKVPRTAFTSINNCSLSTILFKFLAIDNVGDTGNSSNSKDADNGDVKMPVSIGINEEDYTVTVQKLGAAGEDVDCYIHREMLLVDGLRYQVELLLQMDRVNTVEHIVSEATESEEERLIFDRRGSPSPYPWLYT